MANPIVQFVDSPSTTATVRYDFNVTYPTLRAQVMHEGVDLGAPSFTGEPEGIGAVYGYRALSFTHRIVGTRAVALARMSLLAKEMLRSTNWLRFQWDPTITPVYFKTYRTEPGALSLENAGQADAWDIKVPMVADGLAYGPRQTIAQAQIIQAPADLAGPTRLAMHYVLPTIKGDAPTALRVTITPAATQAAGAAASWLISSITGSATMADTVVNIGGSDGFTAGTGTAATSANAAMFAGDQRIVTIGAGSGLVSRLSGNFPTSVPQGRYKVLLRCEADGAGTSDKSYLFQFSTGTLAPTTDPVTLPSVTATAAFLGSALTYRGWVDLGDIWLPLGNAPSPALPDTPPTPTTTYPATFNLLIGTSDNTAGTVRLDAIKLIPVDGPTVRSATTLKAVYNGSVQPSASATAVLSPTLDGDSRSAWMTGSGSAIVTGTTPQSVQLSGRFPMADPSAPQNLLIVMAISQGKSSSSSSTTTLNAQSSLDVSYYPRYLHIGDGT